MAYKTTISIYKQLNVLTIRRQQGWPKIKQAFPLNK